MLFRSPASLKAAAERVAAEDGTSLNQFVATAVAEKLSAMRTAEFFTERRARTDMKAFRRLMRRKRGTAPQSGDEMP